jgi:hypothetical protein
MLAVTFHKPRPLIHPQVRDCQSKGIFNPQADHVGRESVVRDFEPEVGRSTLHGSTDGARGIHQSSVPVEYDQAHR